MVQQNYVADFYESAFMMLKAKLRKVKRALAGWSKSTYGNIFVKKATIEDIITTEEVQFELDLSPKNRAQLKKAKVDSKTCMKLQEEF